ncbi:hypothetical protein SK128_006934 [Halocaridina rubra]|uniref:Uncharacterized protein n=1 Tax=Halocaridina rubra TaxID=373956 RepID=A0AAN9AHC7_HALRR
MSGLHSGEVSSVPEPSGGVSGDGGVNFVCGFSSHRDFCESPTCFSDDDVDGPDSDDVRSEGGTSLVQGGDGGCGDSGIGGGDVSHASYEKKGTNEKESPTGIKVLDKRGSKLSAKAITGETLNLGQEQIRSLPVTASNYAQLHTAQRRYLEEPCGTIAQLKKPVHKLDV